MAELALFCFGSPHILLDRQPLDLPRRKALALLAYLAVTGRGQSRDALAALLWPGYDQNTARGNLRRTLSDLNQNLPGDWLTADRDQVVLPPQAGLWVDVAAFRQHLTACASHGHPTTAVCSACLTPLTAAAELYTDDFLAGFALPDAPDFGLWQVAQAESLRRELAGVLDRLVQCCVAAGQFADGIAHARRWVALDPLHEPAHRALMRLYVSAGDRAAAVRQYEACVAALAADVGMQPEAETTALYEQIRSGALAVGSGAAAPPPPEAPAAVTAPPVQSLPAQPTPFVGRLRELAQIRTHLSDPDCRLLTILGPGGIGKTRLALQAARELAGRFADGVCCVDLTPVEAPDQMAAAILRAVAPQAFGDANARPRLGEMLSTKDLLLVLDNCEHLLEGVDLLPELLHGAARLKVLVTSRERLYLREEWLYPLEGLDFPAVETDGTVPLDAYDATRLFVGCVWRIRPGWEPSPGEAATVARICRDLEGMPLGIELAAAWTRTLPMAEVSRELAYGLNILSSSLRDMPPRHRSMVAVFDQSWRLLEPEQQSVLRQLAVFRGGCTRAAAEVVAGAGLLQLTALVDRSWLRLRADGHYDMHELVRQYCTEKLASEHAAAAGQDPDTVRRRHCDYFAGLLQDTVSQTGFQADLIRVAAPEFVNAQSALLWACARPYVPAISALVSAVWFAGDMLGRHGAAYESVTEAANALASHLDRRNGDGTSQSELVAALAEVCWAQGALAVQVGRVESAQQHIRQLETLVEMMEPGEHKRFYRTAILRRLCQLALREGDAVAARCYCRAALIHTEDEDFVDPWYGKEQGQAFHQADILASVGHADWISGDYAEAERSWRRSITLGQKIGENRQLPQHCAQLARLLVTVGDYPQAEQLALEGAKGSQAVGDEVWTAFAAVALGFVHRAQGDLAAARRELEQGIHMWRRTRYHHLVEAFTELGRVELAAGNTAAARARFAEAVVGVEQSGIANSKYAVAAWLGLGWTALAEGKPAEAGEWFRKALGSSKCTAWEKMEGIAGLAEEAWRTGRCEEAVESLALVARHPFTAHAQRESAKRALQALQAQLAPDVFAARVQAGELRDLDDTLAELTAPSPRTV